LPKVFFQPNRLVAAASYFVHWLTTVTILFIPFRSDL
jgi:hypothetical protein